MIAGNAISCRKIQERYGVARDEAERQVKEYDRSTSRSDFKSRPPLQESSRADLRIATAHRNDCQGSMMRASDGTIARSACRT